MIPALVGASCADTSYPVIKRLAKDMLILLYTPTLCRARLLVLLLWPFASARATLCEALLRPLLDRCYSELLCVNYRLNILLTFSAIRTNGCCVRS